MDLTPRQCYSSQISCFALTMMRRPFVAATLILFLQQQFNLALSTSRARFLSSAMSAFGGVVSVVLAEDTNVCNASTDTPRYLEYTLDMKYGEDSSGNPRTRGMLVRRFTGDSTGYKFPVKTVKLVKEWPEEPPFKPEDFFRTDSNDDGWFYKVPKLVYHIDEPAVAALTQYYRKNIPRNSDILDICSSWVSHYPLEFKDTMKSIQGTGMNGLELQYNDQLSSYVQRDLNVEPSLPYPDNSMDVVTCVVSIDYLVQPITILKEVHRVLRPGGKVIISQSNRCFPTKAISMWLNMNDRQHLELINGYLQYAGGFEPREAFDITAETTGYRDPMFIVQAVKSKA